MIFVDEYSVSFVKKTVFSCAVLLTILICINLLFGVTWFSNNQIVQTTSVENSVHQWLLTIFLVVYFLRLQITVWVFQKRKWTWLETIIISVLVPLGLYMFTIWGKNNSLPIGIIDIIGIVLYVSGSYINSKSEFSRYSWKKKKENRRHIYTEGLFKYSMHINYLGDILLFSGFAMITNCAVSIMIPTVMLLNFMFNIIPSLDRYLGKKYGSEFYAYEKKTRKLVPYIY